MTIVRLFESAIVIFHRKIKYSFVSHRDGLIPTTHTFTLIMDFRTLAFSRDVLWHGALSVRPRDCTFINFVRYNKIFSESFNFCMPCLLRHIRGCCRKPPSQPIEYAHNDPGFTCGRRGYVLSQTAVVEIDQRDIAENKLILAQWRYIVLLHKSLPEPIRTYRHLDLKEQISVYYKLHIVFLSNKCILKRCAPSPFPFVQSPKFKPNTNAITEESLMDEFRLDGWLSDYGSRHLATIVW